MYIVYVPNLPMHIVFLVQEKFFQDTDVISMCPTIMTLQQQLYDNTMKNK